MLTKTLKGFAAAGLPSSRVKCLKADSGRGLSFRSIASRSARRLKCACVIGCFFGKSRTQDFEEKSFFNFRFNNQLILKIRQ